MDYNFSELVVASKDSALELVESIKSGKYKGKEIPAEHVMNIAAATEVLLRNAFRCIEYEMFTKQGTGNIVEYNPQTTDPSIMYGKS